MKYPVHRHLLAGIAAILSGLLLIFVLPFILIVVFIVSIPSKVGKKIRIEDWIFEGITRLLNVQLMRQFRDDIYYRLRPHIELDEELERWWIIREIDLARERANRDLQSGEYAIVLLLAMGSLSFESTVYAVPMSVALTLLALGLSGLVIVRTVTFKILAFRSDAHLEETTDELGLRLAFNRGPFSQGSSVGIAFVALLVAAADGQGYELGLNIIESVAAETHPSDADRWRADS